MTDEQLLQRCLGQSGGTALSTGDGFPFPIGPGVLQGLPSRENRTVNALNRLAGYKFENPLPQHAHRPPTAVQVYHFTADGVRASSGHPRSLKPLNVKILTFVHGSLTGIRRFEMMRRLGWTSSSDCSRLEFSFRKRIRSKVGIFFVRKKDPSAIRMIFDARITNCHHRRPPVTRLGSAVNYMDLRSSLVAKPLVRMAMAGVRKWTFQTASTGSISKRWPRGSGLMLQTASTTGIPMGLIYILFSTRKC